MTYRHVPWCPVISCLVDRDAVYKFSSPLTQEKATEVYILMYKIMNTELDGKVPSFRII